MLEEEVSNPLGDNFFIILLAYVAAFLPWTAVSATDFISPSYKTARATRRAGVTNLLLAFVPAVYIVFYIVLQAMIDYKEMFAAVVALFFSLLHMARTAWGLWQLSLFVRWAARAIRALAKVGVSYRFRDGKYETPEAIAEHLLVNDELIDNQLFHGHARCYLHYAGTDFKTDPHRGGLLYQRLLLLLQLLFLPFRYAANYVLSLLGLTQAEHIRMVPHQPIDVWIRWAVAFAAQGLGDWITNFTVASDPDVRKHTSNAELYQLRRDYFAGEVLAAAGMQIWPDDSFPLVEGGKTGKMDLFWPAVFSGKGLPFDAPQVDVLSDVKGDVADISRSAYRPYTRKLARVVEGMPVVFGSQIEGFDVERLEWLAILLSLGVKIMKEEGELDEEFESYTSTTPSESSTTVETDDEEEFVDETDPELDDGDLALDNLRTQLGFRTEDKAPTDPDMGIAGFSAAPLPNWCFHSLSDGNRLVTKVGEFIDCWLALVAGDQLKFLLSMDEKWAHKCLAGNSPGIPFAIHSPTTGRRLNRTNEALRSAQTRVEKARLAYQFAVKQQPHWHMEQTLTFMGHTLESVRTCLARWVAQPSEKKGEEDDWKPRVFDEGLLKTPWLNLGVVRKPFAKGLAKAQNARFFERKAAQVRIVWELQTMLCDQLYEGAAAPSSMRAVMMCMLGFPSLAVEVNTDDDHDSIDLERLATTQQRKDSLAVFLGWCCKSGKANASIYGHLTWLLNIRPICAPQEHGISAKFVSLPDEAYSLHVRLYRSSCSRDESFEWEWWRDAAMARMEGLAQWQKAHDMRAIDLFPTEISIKEVTRELQVILKGTGKSFTTWSGWKPFRFEHCRFELESPEFLLHFETSRTVNFFTGESQDDRRKHRLPRAERRALSYMESEREQLRHSCFVIREVIPEEGKDEDEGMNEILTKSERADRLIREAQSLQAQRSENFDRAMLLLEVAAVELDSIKALRECVKLLTDPTTTTKDPRRAALLIEFCLASQLKKKHGNYARLTQAHEDFGSQTFHTMFADLVVKGGFKKETVIPFCNYLAVVISVDQGSSIAKCFCWFRRMFMYSRRYEVLEVLATTMRSARVLNSSDADIDLSDDACGHFEGFIGMKIADAGRQKSINKLSKAFYERAVRDGQNVSSMNELGLLLLKGDDGVERNPQYAQDLFKYAIKYKSVYAMNNLGLLFLNGAPGITPDPAQAKALFERAVKKGRLTSAMYNLAKLLCYGAEGVEKDPEEAVELFKLAIKNGHHSKAMYHLGLMYETGIDGVEKNVDNAVQLYEMAINEDGDHEAHDRLADLLGFSKRGHRRGPSRGTLSHLLESPPSSSFT